MKITDQEMTSDVTPHTAQAIDGGWVVTWLPARVLSRNEAITAMSLAQAVATVNAADPAGLPDPSRLWPHITGWAAELGMSDVDAAALATLCPEWHVLYGESGPITADLGNAL